MKRFQESNKIVKLLKCCWYIPLPIKWLLYSTIMKFKVFKDEIIDGEMQHTNQFNVIKGKKLWHLLKGDAQLRMGWYYTHEEVMEEMDNKVKKYKENESISG